jgi:sec-independent protein translocase protein TatA
MVLDWLVLISQDWRFASKALCSFQARRPFFAAIHRWLTPIPRRLMFEGLFQPLHLLIIFGIALLVFGPKKLPELGKGIGDGIRGFKSAIKDQPDAPDKNTALKDQGS